MTTFHSEPHPNAFKVTLVTNDRDTRLELERVLTEAGLVVLSAPNGLKLLSALHVDAPDAIVLDLDVSWTDAGSLCLAISHRPETAGVPIICVSSGQKPDRVTQCFAGGAKAHLLKPVDSAALLQQFSLLGMLGERPPRDEEST